MEHSAIHQILNYASHVEASDIHISEGKPLMFRVDGELVLKNQAGIIGSNEITKILSELLYGSGQDIQEFVEGKDMDFAYVHDDGCSFRVNAFYKLGKISFVLRRINKEVHSMKELGLPPSAVELTELKQGLILITGPTGAGKSTTMVSFLEEINKKRGEHIVTIEDPVEFIFQDDKSIFSQRQVGRDTNSFQKALRAVVREDPDVIMIGEMRDAETVKMALELAETGHLVISTLHTSSASTSINRMLSFFPSSVQESVRYKISDNLQGVISQRLLKRRDKKGRIAMFGVMLMEGGIKNLIREGNLVQIQSVIEVGKKHGMIAMPDYAKMLEFKGIILKEDYVHYFQKEEE